MIDSSVRGRQIWYEIISFVKKDYTINTIIFSYTLTSCFIKRLPSCDIHDFYILLGTMSGLMSFFYSKQCINLCSINMEIHWCLKHFLNESNRVYLSYTRWLHSDIWITRGNVLLSDWADATIMYGIYLLYCKIAQCWICQYIMTKCSDIFATILPWGTEIEFRRDGAACCQNDKLTLPWRYQMETFTSLLAFCEGNPPVTGGFPF